MTDQEYIMHIKQNSKHWENLYFTSKDIIQKQSLAIERLEIIIKRLQKEMQDN